MTNSGQLPSGPFFVRFTLSGDQDPPKDLDFSQDAGLDAGAPITAVVHFGAFPNKFATYHLDACIYSSSAPEKAINCAGSFDFTINTESTSDSGSGGDSNRGTASDSSEKEIRSLFQTASADRFIHIWRTFHHDTQPHMSRVWPHSRSKGWMDRLEQVIPYA